MENPSGTIEFAGVPKAQVQLITGEDGTRKAQLYSKSGICLCGCEFNGEDDVGFAVGQALFNGYIAGWNNSQYAISRAVTKALYNQQDYTTI